MELLWILLGILYIVAVVTLGLMTFRAGHYWMFWLGFFMPLLWLIGAMIQPTDAARQREAVGHGTA